MRANGQMNLAIGLLLVCLSFALVACAKPEITPDPDSLAIVSKSEQARQIAQKEISDAVLRQVNTDLHKTTFYFTDTAGTKEIDITTPSPDAPPDQWSTYPTSLSPLLGQPESDMNIKDLRVGPSRVAQAITAQWLGCQIHGFTLYRDDSENELTWVAFCDTPQGMVSGTMSNRTSVFQSSNAPPARVPLTATPVP